MNPITNFEKWINSIATGEAPDITPATRLDHFLNKIRQTIARKSDLREALPPYSLSDKGKALTVSATPTGFGTTIVQEQTVTLEEAERYPGAMFALGTTDYSSLEGGDSVIIMINGTPIECTYDSKEGVIYDDELSPTAFIYIEYNAIFIPDGTIGDTYTVSAGTPILVATPEWKTLNGIPNITERDFGRYLRALPDGSEWVEIQDELPPYSGSDSGKVLALYTDRESQRTSPQWQVRNPVPNYSASDKGKILYVKNSGSLGWAEKNFDEFLITITLPPNSSMPYTCDKTPAQIKAAFDEGKTITGRTVFEGFYHSGAITLHYGNNGLSSLSLLTAASTAINVFNYDLTRDSITVSSVSLS